MRSADRGNQFSRESVQSVNHEDFAEVSRRIDVLLEQMATAAQDYSTSKAVLEYGSDRRKNALSTAISGLWEKDPELSATAAEHKARASTGYRAAIDQLYRDEVTAENIVTGFNIIKARLEAARSQLAVHRELIGML